MEKLAESYEESARLLSARLAELRKLLAEATDPDDVWHIKRRIADLTPMLTECNAIAEYCRHYYDRGYYIGDGPFGTRKRNEQTAIIRSRAKNKNYNGHGIDRLSAGSGHKAYFTR